MIRTPRTLLLSAAALGALATAAMAAPLTPPTSHDTTGGMVSMHATGTTQMHPGGGDMTVMHAAMMAEPAVHDSMLNDPTMQAHMADYGIDADQTRQWHEADRSVDGMHEALAAQGIDVEGMHAACPIPTDESMPTMHDNGGLHPSGHHNTPTK